jgi:hypothetical protein
VGEFHTKSVIAPNNTSRKKLVCFIKSALPTIIFTDISSAAYVDVVQAYGMFSINVL